MVGSVTFTIIPDNTAISCTPTTISCTPTTISYTPTTISCTPTTTSWNTSITVDSDTQGNYSTASTSGSTCITQCDYDSDTIPMQNNIHYIAFGNSVHTRNKIMRWNKLYTHETKRRNDVLMQENKYEAETRARALLREMIGEKAFRRYLKSGFIMAKGRSGLFYKISGRHIGVTCYIKFKDGSYNPIENLCIVFKNSSLPYTDWVIMRKLMVENDEFGLRNIANITAIQLRSAG